MNLKGTNTTALRGSTFISPAMLFNGEQTLPRNQ